MKALFFFVFLFLTTTLSAQFDPHSAGRIKDTPVYYVPFNNVAAPPGVNTGCLTNLTNVSWAYFAICDSQLTGFDFNSINQDSLEIIMYGPFQDTTNLLTKLQSPPLICYIRYPTSTIPSYMSYNLAPGIYYVLCSTNNIQSNLNITFDFGGNPINPDPNMCRICDGFSDLEAKVCVIDLDPVSQRNKLSWEKIDTANIAGYIIYRENSTFALFDSLAFIPVTDFSEYIDLSANPASRAWRYRIYKMDVCGQVPDSFEVTVNFHNYRTLFLQQGVSGLNSVNLTWNSNSQPGSGYWSGTYYIYRGASQSNLTLIDSIPSNQYTDVNPLPGPNYYQVERRKYTTCSPSLLPGYTKSGSNLTGVLFVGIEDVLPEATFSIYPNPVADEFSINLHEQAKIQQNTFILLTGDGKQLGEYHSTESLESEGKSLLPGIYIIRIVNSKGTASKRFIKL